MDLTIDQGFQYSPDDGRLLDEGDDLHLAALILALQGIHVQDILQKGSTHLSFAAGA